MQAIWAIYDQKCSDPINFTTEKAAVDYATKWLQGVFGEKLEGIRRRDSQERGRKSITFIADPGIRMLAIHESPLYEAADEPEQRTDYPRISL